MRFHRGRQAIRGQDWAGMATKLFKNAMKLFYVPCLLNQRKGNIQYPLKGGLEINMVSRLKSFAAIPAQPAQMSDVRLSLSFYKYFMVNG